MCGIQIMDVLAIQIDSYLGHLDHISYSEDLKMALLLMELFEQWYISGLGSKGKAG